ncbi:nuclear transport factor 2 family protein [Luteimonas sp. S4-F44]|uniref:YybH family protein n=1 Tax=Luteimonas sp. S4-F44 TaxID=2925842 RepID=UPI001F52E9F8|nr:nuclear transport factor 2 family protein [Luteimonas sp. S4-F44]UNK42529.1 nuclear transport factor 2 family protein [Luteimonas sp. S4-F44]
MGLVLAAGAQAQPSPERGTRVEHEDVALPPELARVLRDYERAWRAGDAVALAALFAEDGFVLQSNRPPVRGRAAIQAAYAGQGGGPLRLRAFAFAAEDTIAYIVDAYGYGDAPSDAGKFTLTLRREEAGAPWRIASDMDNSNAPLRAQGSNPPAPPAQQPAEP